MAGAGLVIDRRASLLAIARDLPAGAAVTVPREWILELFGEAEISTAADLRVRDLAERYHRSPATVRTWCELGRFPGAYRFQNREWRVPAPSLAIFEAAERERAGRPRGSDATAAPAAGEVVDLSDWRRTGR
jgi:hypothetical protein